jgi:hypothetical protein
MIRSFVPKFFRQKFVKEFFIICLVCVLCIKRGIINQVLFREKRNNDCKSYRAFNLLIIQFYIVHARSKTDDSVNI